MTTLLNLDQNQAAVVPLIFFEGAFRSPFIEFIGTPNFGTKIFAKKPASISMEILTVSCEFSKVFPFEIINLENTQFTLKSTFANIFDRKLFYIIQDPDTFNISYFSANNLAELPSNFTSIYEVRGPAVFKTLIPFKITAELEYSGGGGGFGGGFGGVTPNPENIILPFETFQYDFYWNAEVIYNTNKTAEIIREAIALKG
jgi:hypothetical protein